MVKKVKTEIKGKPVPVQSLYEKVDIDMLLRIISADNIDLDLRASLISYYLACDYDLRYKKVDYFYAEGAKNGRLYAKGGKATLQGMKREVRHAICKDLYWDIDMKNAHPYFLLQYCEKNKIPCIIIKKYVNHREKVLGRVMNHYNYSRDQAKALIISVMYGDMINYKEDAKCLIGLKQEMVAIGEYMNEHEKEILDLIPENATNRIGKLISRKMTIIENEVLMMVKQILEDCGCKVSVLCFDGLMIEKDPAVDIHAILDSPVVQMKLMMNHDYHCILDVKPMDDILPFTVPLLPKICKSDHAAAQLFVSLVGIDNVKYCGDKLYIFNDETGMFETSEELVYTYLIKYKEYFQYFVSRSGKGILANYTDTAVRMKSLIPIIKTITKDNDWLHKVQNSSLGFLLFKNGHYHFEGGIFIKGFNPKIVFFHRVPYDFSEECIDVYQDKVLTYFEQVFDKKDGCAMLYSISHALAGDLGMKTMYLCPGNGNSGKSTLFKLLKSVFGSYVANFNAENLCYTSKMDSKEEAQLMRFALQQRFCRLLVSSEVNMDKTINSNLLKKFVSGGKDEIMARFHGENEVNFYPHFTMFCIFNDLPDIKPLDTATESRLKFIGFKHNFTDVIVNESDRLKDENFDTCLNDPLFIQAFIQIILSGYYLEDIEYDEELKDEWIDDKRQKTNFDDFFNEHLVFTGNNEDKINAAKIKKLHEDNKNILRGMSYKVFVSELKNRGAKPFKSGLRGYTGLVLNKSKYDPS